MASELIYPNHNINVAYVDTENYYKNNLNYVNNPYINFQSYQKVEPSAPTPPMFTNNKTIVDSIFQKKIYKISCCILTSFISVTIVAIIIIYAILPCVFMKCHSNAKCVNSRAFTSQCFCNYGYSGNGKTKCDECGLRSKEPNLRIINGIDSIQSSWPEAVYLIFSYSAKVEYNKEVFQINYSSFCGGTLINHKSVLTAAHCIPTRIEHRRSSKVVVEVPVVPNSFFPSYESMIKVYIGVYNRSTVSKSTPNYEYSVEKLIKHEKYNPTTLLNDIAILKLNKLVTVNENVQYACLPETNTNSYPLPKDDAWIVGWGQTELNKSSMTLKNGKIKIYNSSQCDKVSLSYPKSWNIQLCAGDIQKLIDTCQGDSGGGLFVKDLVNKKTKFILSGITSYGEGCAQPNKPGIYTRTSFYLNWINKNSFF